ncbi:MAG: acyltransferase [Bacteroidia bacterium]|nr:acyltransferase [Bacteroidia bacterium]
MQREETPIYFSGINSLRFFAATSVIITHIELLKSSLGFKNYWKNTFIFNLGGLGVYFFFVLSGFLITYLLLEEKSRYTKIKIRDFYIRRVLRIWPLYYLILIIGFFILPHFNIFHISYLENSFHDNFNTNLILYVGILPNLAFSMFPAVPNIGQAWSIGVEEQFYLLWPWVISKSKNIVKTLLIIITTIVLLKVCVLLMGNFYSHSSWYKVLKLFVAMSKFECMAIGGIGAYYLFTKDDVLSIIYNKAIFLVSITMVPVLIYITPDVLQDGIHIVYSILFLIIILNISNGNMFRKNENIILNYLGKISYGLYMYHLMIIPFVLYVFKNTISISSEGLSNILIYTGTISLTIVISSISYHFLETPFIKFKSKFSPVKSGDDKS